MQLQINLAELIYPVQINLNAITNQSKPAHLPTTKLDHIYPLHKFLQWQLNLQKFIINTTKFGISESNYLHKFITAAERVNQESEVKLQVKFIRQQRE